MKGNRRIAKDRVRQSVAWISAMSLIMSNQMAYALPQGGQVSAGQAAIVTGANNVDVNQVSQRAVINWQGFDVGSGETVNFNQPSSTAIALNRIGGGSASQILGDINANDQVWLMNPNGVVFGSNAQVNVGGLLATTSNITDSDFMSGNFSFSQVGDVFAYIFNAGRIKIADGGVAALEAIRKGSKTPCFRGLCC